MLNVLVIQIQGSACVRKSSAVGKKERSGKREGETKVQSKKILVCWVTKELIICFYVELAMLETHIGCYWEYSAISTMTLIDIPSLTLDSWQFLMAPLINHYTLTSMCASYIRQGRVTEFVPIDFAPAQQTNHPHPSSHCQQDPALPWHTFCYIISFTQFPGIHSGQEEARNQGGDGDGPRGCKAL